MITTVLIYENEPHEQIRQALLAKITSPKELTNYIDNLFEEKNYSDEFLLSCVVKTLSTAENFSLLIKILLNDEEALQKIGDEARQHNIGFDKITLLSAKNFKLRFHNFHASHADRNVHSHRWNFYSALLKGTIYSNTYKLTCREAQNECNTYRCGPSGSGVREFQLQGKSYLTKVDSQKLSAPEQYYFSTDMIHQIIDTEPESCTLMMTGPPKDDISYFYTVVEKPEAKQHISLSLEKVKIQLQAICDFMTKKVN